MLVKRLKRQDINGTQWDLFIENSVQNVLYAKSWFLDAIPQKWEAFVAYENGVVIGVLPFQLKQKYGLKKIQLDPYVHELGIFHLPDRQDCITALLEQFKKSIFISDYRFNIHNDFEGIDVGNSNNFTYTIDLNQDIHLIRKSYSNNIKRNIKMAKDRRVLVSSVNDIELLLDIFRKYVAHKITGLEEYQFDILRDLYKVLCLKKQCEIYMAYVDNKPVSGSLIIKDNRRIIYFMAASNKEGKLSNSQSLVIDTILEKYADSNLIFDFEGEATDGLKRYYASFGSSRRKIPTYRKMLGEKWYQKVYKIKALTS